MRGLVQAQIRRVALAESSAAQAERFMSQPAATTLILRSHAASHGVSNDEGSKEVRNRGRLGLVLRDAGPSGPAPQDEAMEWPIRQAPLAVIPAGAQRRAGIQPRPA